jgi:HAD superfamily hydrolase (TIGR01509 family)
VTSPGVRVVLSDLDDTLFDHDRATRDALTNVRQLCSAFERWTLDELDHRHREILEELHLRVLTNELSIEDARIERFRRLLLASGEDWGTDRVAEIARRYRTCYETAWHPVAGAMELVTALRRSGRSVIVVTNNHVAEQQRKLDRLGLTPLVDALVTSEEAGCCKPEPDIFRQALARAGASVEEAVMLGDAWHIDIEGARGVGLRAVWLNRFNRRCPDSDVTELTSLEPVAAAMKALAGHE